MRRIFAFSFLFILCALSSFSLLTLSQRSKCGDCLRLNSVMLNYTYLNESYPKEALSFKASCDNFYQQIFYDERALFSEIDPFYHAMLHSFRKGVMRADFFRYYIVWKHGGCYRDLDVECLTAIPFKPSSLVISLENDLHFCQWFFCAERGNAYLKAVIDLIYSKWLGGINYLNRHYVHATTGPGVFTEAIAKMLNATPNSLRIFHNHEWIRYRLIILPRLAFRGVFVMNHYASQKWKQSYVSWEPSSET